MAWRGGTRSGAAGKARQGEARLGMVWHGRRGRVRYGELWRVAVGHGTAGVAWTLYVKGVKQLPKYSWKTGFHACAPADEVMGELAQLGVGETGVTPEMVLERARDGHSILHSFFEWDDSIAAEKYRVEQAGSLIRAIVILPEAAKASTVIRAVVRVSDGQEKGRYWETERAMSDKEMSKQVLRDAAKDAQSMAARYRGLSRYSEKLMKCAVQLEEMAGWLHVDESA